MVVAVDVLGAVEEAEGAADEEMSGVERVMVMPGTDQGFAEGFRIATVKETGVAGVPRRGKSRSASV